MRIPRLDSRRVVRAAIGGNLSPQGARLLQCAIRAVPPGRRYVIGGVIALGEAGFGRHSGSLEVLVGRGVTAEFVKVLASRGFSTRLLPNDRAIAFLEDDNRFDLAEGREATVRIEVADARNALARGALRSAVTADRFGFDVRVMRADYLAASKFLRAHPLDLLDFDELIRLGGDEQKIRKLVAMSRPTRAAAVSARIRKVQNKPKTVFDPRARWLDRDALQAAWEASEAKRATNSSEEHPR